MNIKILDSWLREYLKTKATHTQIAEKLSLTSLSVERVEKFGEDYLYEMEVTTNRPDLFSVVGVAREASAILPQFGIQADFVPIKSEEPKENFNKFPIEIENDPNLVNRICAVVIEVKIGKSPQEVSKRLEASDIRSLNNVIDVTNYVMQTLGHPTHVFDLDRLSTDKIKIREGRQGEKITTLDGKTYFLKGGEIIAADKNNRIIDLLGIMGLENSVVTEKTKKILFFIDNNDKARIRQASMQLGIRTNAAALNEKGIDPNLAMEALLYGISLFRKNASGVQISKILDVYENKPKERKVSVSFEKIDKVIGVKINPQKSQTALKALGFEVNSQKDKIEVSIPSFRLNDIFNEEDIVEEIARVYGYFNLPSILPPNINTFKAARFVNEFYFEQRVKKAMKYWGFTETYTYSFVSEDMFEGPTEDAVEIANPLNEEFVYMRNSLIPSLLKVISSNKDTSEIKIFEIANIYIKNQNKLPNEILTLSGIVKKQNVNFYEVKGLIEQVTNDLGINDLTFKKSAKSSLSASLYINKDYLGEIEVLDNDLIDFELNFQLILKHATIQKEFVALPKFPPIVEDITISTTNNTSTIKLIEEIKKQSEIIAEVTLIGEYENSKTFHVIYQDLKKNLTKKDVSQVREKIASHLQKLFSAEIR